MPLFFPYNSAVDCLILFSKLPIDISYFFVLRELKFQPFVGKNKENSILRLKIYILQMALNIIWITNCSRLHARVPRE